MGRIFGLLLGLLAIYTTLEVYQKGTAGAFNGALARFAGEDAVRNAWSRRATATLVRTDDAVVP